MNVDLTPELEQLVQRKVLSGLYNSASEVITEALRLMNEREQVNAVPPARDDDPHRASPASMRGKYSGLIGGSEDFMRRKHEDTDRELRRWNERQQRGRSLSDPTAATDSGAKRAP